MRKKIKLIVVLMLLASSFTTNAQSTAAAIATATIVTPVTVSSPQPNVFERITPNSSLGNVFRTGSSSPSIVTAAELTINGGINDLYTITIPRSVLLVNASGMERLSAEFMPLNSTQEVLPYGQQRLNINAGIQVENGQMPGRYISPAFEVTVNFN